jgi:hypothetical protein
MEGQYSSMGMRQHSLDFECIRKAEENRGRRKAKGSQKAK